VCRYAPELAAAKVPLKTMRLNQAKNAPITSSIQGLLGKDTELKYLAQRAVVSYLRSIYLQPNKEVFDVNALDVDAYAHSMGLPNPPRLRFLKCKKKGGKGTEGGEDGDSEDGDSDEEEEGKAAGASGRGNRAKGGAGEEGEEDEEDDEDSDEEDEEDERGTSAGVLKRTGGGHFGLQVDNADEDDDLMTVKRVDHKLSNAAAADGSDNEVGLYKLNSDAP
jgi:ATP-dependent RNA helicase DDX10/DBP4